MVNNKAKYHSTHLQCFFFFSLNPLTVLWNLTMSRFLAHLKIWEWRGHVRQKYCDAGGYLISDHIAACDKRQRALLRTTVRVYLSVWRCLCLHTYCHEKYAALWLLSLKLRSIMESYCWWIKILDTKAYSKKNIKNIDSNCY